MSTSFLQNIDKSWTLFLDRDGVINKRIFGGYVTNPSEFEFLPGVLDSLVFFTSVFNRIIIVTNQQGVEKGIMSEDKLITLHKHMQHEINNVGGNVDEIYYCTNLATSPNNCRKPSIKMAQKAMNDFPEIEMAKSIMVGDSPSDIEFGKNAGMKTIFVATKGGDKLTANSPDLEINNLHELKVTIQSPNHSHI